MDDILSGLEDVPKIAYENCTDCGVLITKDNFSGWFRFVKKDGQMYEVPICNECDKAPGNSPVGTKIEE